MQPTEKIASPQAQKLYDALCKRKVHAELEYYDGFKTVDIAIRDARIYVEVDGINHFINPDQIVRDFKRSHFSDGDDFRTFYVTNQILDRYLDEVADALKEVVDSYIPAKTNVLY